MEEHAWELKPQHKDTVARSSIRGNKRQHTAAQRHCGHKGQHAAAQRWRASVISATCTTVGPDCPKGTPTVPHQTRLLDQASVMFEYTENLPAADKLAKLLAPSYVLRAAGVPRVLLALRWPGNQSTGYRFNICNTIQNIGRTTQAKV